MSFESLFQGHVKLSRFDDSVSVGVHGSPLFTDPLSHVRIKLSKTFPSNGYKGLLITGEDWNFDQSVVRNNNNNNKIGIELAIAQLQT